MKYTENALNIITAKSYKGIGKAWLVKNLKGNENVNKIVSKLNDRLKEKTSEIEFVRLRDSFEKKLKEKLKDNCDGFLAIGDAEFPQHRGNVKDSEKPVFLYYKGDINLLSIDNTNIAVIGLLNPSENIIAREKDIVSSFVKKGATIVSGLALGCDSIAHEEALFRNGKTVAILPSPLNNIMPATNKALAYKIVEEGGLLVSEYGSDFKSKMELSSRYQERDRLQALFSDAIILAASYSKDSAKKWSIYDKKLDSGARLAMGYAENYHIPQAVMYDETIDEFDPMFDLNRELLNSRRDLLIFKMEKISQTLNKLVKKKSSANHNAGRQGSLF